MMRAIRYLVAASIGSGLGYLIGSVSKHYHLIWQADVLIGLIVVPVVLLFVLDLEFMIREGE